MSENLSASSNPIFSSYLEDIRAWHGFVRFLGLPTYQTNPDVRIDDLYVPHFVSESYISPDTSPDTWEVSDPVIMLSERRRLVILGDPGSGKSTLVNWFAWYLASGFSRRLPGALDGLLPIPIVLRDINFEGVTSMDKLIDAFLSRPVASCLQGKKAEVMDYVRSGRAMLLIDGLDEIPGEVGKLILKIVSESSLDNSCFVVITSRIVGSADLFGIKEGDLDRSSITLSEGEGARSDQLQEVFRTVYVAPFNQEQISRFVFNWYQDYEKSDSEIAALRDDLVLAINSSESILRLARTPNLLTMMALIFKVRARLPNGRALLYDDIAQAYLESIDTARKIKDEFSWKSKKRWLARVAFEMQLRRDTSKTSGGASRELLADRSEVLTWLKDSMARMDDVHDSAYAEKYLDWIARRSGLLLPRGEGKYAFLHLSFQEYFSAIYIKSQIEHHKWNSRASGAYGLDDRVSSASLKAWANKSSWSQVFMFLFELAADISGWADRLLSIVVPKVWTPATSSVDSINKYSKGAVAQLIVSLLENSHSGIVGRTREGAIKSVMEVVFKEQRWLAARALSGRRDYGRITLLARLLSAASSKAFTIDWIAGQGEELEGIFVSGASADAISEVRRIADQIPSLKYFSADSSSVGNIDFVRCWPELEYISARNSSVEDASVLGSLRNLRMIFLDYTKVSDISFLRYLRDIRWLSIDGVKVSDFDPVFSCSELREFSAAQTTFSDLGLLSNAKKIDDISLSSTLVTDLSALRFFGELRFLSFNGCDIDSIDSLESASELIYIGLGNTGISDFSALSGLTNLSHIYLRGCPLDTLEDLARIPSLVDVNIDLTLVEDLSPLKRLKRLSRISFNYSRVKDVSPLARCKSLRKVSMEGCDVVGVEALSRKRFLTITM